MSCCFFLFSSPEITDPAVPETDIAMAKDELPAIVFDFSISNESQPDFRVLQNTPKLTTG